MNLKYGLVFWFTTVMLLVGTPQMLMVEGLDCDVCVRYSNVPGSGPCARMPCNSKEDAMNSLKIFMKESEEMEKKFRIEVGKELEAQTSSSSTQTPQVIPRAGAEHEDTPQFVCIKLLERYFFPRRTASEVDVSDKMGTHAKCESFTMLRPPQAEPYSGMPDERAHPFAKKSLWYVCDEKNAGDCRVDEAGDLKKLGMGPSGSAHSFHAAWILITFSCFIAGAAAAAGVGIDIGDG